MFEDLEAAMKRFMETGEVGWPDIQPVTLEQELPNEVKFMEDISRASHIARPLADVLTDILEKLKTVTDADAVAIFGWHPLTKEVRLEASVNVKEEHFARCKPDLYRSPVTDLVYRSEQPMFFNDIDKQAYGKFYYLRPILGHRTHGGGWPLQSCIGETVEAGGEWAYTLFLFGRRVKQFGSIRPVCICRGRRGYQGALDY